LVDRRAERVGVRPHPYEDLLKLTGADRRPDRLLASDLWRRRENVHAPSEHQRGGYKKDCGCPAREIA
jgi:hypothetical protein